MASHQATVCHREHIYSDGGATVHGVVLADGFVVETGSSGLSLARARLLARAVNAFGADQFTADALAGECPF